MHRYSGVGGALGKGILAVAIVVAITLSHGCTRDSESSSAGSSTADTTLFRNLGKR